MEHSILQWLSWEMLPAYSDILKKQLKSLNTPLLRKEERTVVLWLKNYTTINCSSVVSKINKLNTLALTKIKEKHVRV